jgi:hypothetical protein
MLMLIKTFNYEITTDTNDYINTLRMGDANLHLCAYKQFKYPVPNVLSCSSKNTYITK